MGFINNTELDFFENQQLPKPEHGKEGEYRRFFGSWDENTLQYSGDRFGSDVYCANCNHWNTVKDTGILFSIAGDCKNCGTSFLK